MRGVGPTKARQGWGRTMTHTKTRRTFRYRQTTYRRAIQQDSLKRGDDRPGTIGLSLDRQNRREERPEHGPALSGSSRHRPFTPPPSRKLRLRASKTYLSNSLTTCARLLWLECVSPML